jgi:hypothetical protein
MEGINLFTYWFKIILMFCASFPIIYFVLSFEDWRRELKSKKYLNSPFSKGMIKVIPFWKSYYYRPIRYKFTIYTYKNPPENIK